MAVDILQLPIPDWGLECPRCRYLLKGLPRHRCPECGLRVDMREIVKPWTRVRDPRFTGRELPVPDFGLSCARCAAPLAGAPTAACSFCQTPFDLAALRPTREWFILDHVLCGPLSITGMQSLLAAEQVPFMPVNEQTLSELYGGQRILAHRLRVASEFFFETLWLIQRARGEFEAARAQVGRFWVCGGCGEENPGNFELCWNCQRARPEPGTPAKPG